MPADGSPPGLSVRAVAWAAGVIVFVAVAVGAVLAVSAFNYASEHEDPTVLAAIKRDAMTTYVPPASSRVVYRYERNAHIALGEPVSAQLDRTFDVPASSGKAAFRDAMNAARRAGWPIALPTITLPHLPGDQGYAHAQRPTDQSNQPPNFRLTISLTGAAPGQTSPAPGTTNSPSR